MRKLGLALMMAAAALFTTTVATSGTHSQAVKISGVSHKHPMCSSTSFVCPKISGRRGEKVRVSASGPGANVPGASYSKMVKFRRAGMKIINFRISAPGPYTLRAGGKSRSYTVPDPPDPQDGPFPCT
jgi:hypothetical protein